MIKNIKNKYENVTVKLDNNEFIDCQFVNCALKFSGTSPVSLSGCSFANVTWVFSGPAQNTLQFVTEMYHGMGDQGKKIIEQTFENIKKAK